MCRTKYGFYFPDGTGYLFVARLGNGNQGEIQLVWSVQDQSLCVRKQPTKEVGSCEVCMIRTHPSIPRLIAHADHTPAPQGSYCKPATTYWTWCNGGDLQLAVQNFKSAGKRAPEAFLWRLFQQILAALGHIHGLDPPVVHRDVFCGNVFLHWLSETCKLPDFYLGDFGHAALVGYKITATTARAASFSNDLSSLVYTMRTPAQESLYDETMLHETDTGYSPALFEAFHKLDVMAFMARTTSHYEPESIVEVMSMVEDGLSRAAEVTDDCVRRFKPVPTRNVPWLHDDRAQALEVGADIVGPWQLAAINSKTFKIIKVFPDWYGKPKLPSTGTKNDPLLPTDSNPAAGGMTYSQYLKLKKDEASAPPELESPVPGMEAEDDVYEMTSSDERLMGMR